MAVLVNTTFLNVTANAVRTLRRGSVASLFLTCAAPAFAMGSNAPFTPPRPASASASAASDAPETAAVSGLSGVRLGQHSAALIDGQWVAHGGTVRSARLVALQADAATLRHADGRLERLLMNPTAFWSARPAPLSAATARALRPIAEK